MEYNFGIVESKWQDAWYASDTFRADERSGKPKYYLLEQFPYPSGTGLHLGHCLIYTIGDTIARYKRMQGFEVLHPMGWDAFGLPTENHAIKEGIHPVEITRSNTDNFRRQMKRMGWSYDWSREIDTTAPDYFKWTQWIWKQLYQAGLAYKAKASVNWCDACKVGVAHEEVAGDGTHERCDNPVRRREMSQWMFRITDYAQSLLDGLDTLPEWPRGTVEAQRKWIGRSVGADVDFDVVGHDATVRIYTTRPDTLFGATYMVLAPEHHLVDQLTTAEQRQAVDAYRTEATRKSDLARTDLAKEKTGVFTGGYAVNPVNGAHIPVWVADYVLVSYGTGAIMAVPGHDTRDFEFAQTLGLSIVRVLHDPDVATDAPLDAAYTKAGTLCNSANDEVSLNGLSKDDAVDAITTWLETQGRGGRAVRFKLRDWVFARQRYWGEPFPLVFDADGGVQLMDDADLPLELPMVDSYQPTDTGASPLAAIGNWVNTQAGRRETDTMPNWAGSSWYWIRFMDPHNPDALAAMDAQRFWGQVDLYIGGTEHVVLHDLYARFWNQALFDLGHVAVREPFARLLHQGMVLAEDGRKFSKRLGNGVAPDEVIDEHGADVLRMHLNFLGPAEATKRWNPNGLKAMRRFLERVQTVCERTSDVAPSRETLHELHRCIQGVTRDYESISLNTVLAKLMELTNHLMRLAQVPRDVLTPLLIMLSPQAPHFAEEWGERLGIKGRISERAFPNFDPALAMADEITLVVQVNGKLRDRLNVARDTPKADLETMALAAPKIAQYLEDKQIRRVICIPGKLVNIVVG